MRLTYRRFAGTAVLASLVFFAGTSSATAAAGDPSLDQCFSGTVTPPCTQVSPNFTGIEPKVSPDGNQVYLLSYNPPQVRIFDRGPGNKLTPRTGAGSCFNSSGAEGCTAVSGLGAVGFDLDISPDGKSLYVASGSLSHLQRDPSTGNLTPAGCYGPAAGCTSFAPLTAAYAVVVSNDGQSVYTRGGDTFGAFQRSQANGTLVPEPDGEDCFSESPAPGCTDTYGLSGNAFEMDLSPDGKFLYYPIQSPGGIGFFQRSANGSLTQISGVQGGCITTDGSSSAANECASIPDGSGPAMGNAWAATVSPSGRYAFVSGSAGTVVFARDQETGKLTKTYCIAPTAINGCNQRSGSAGMGVAVSPDGTRAIVGSNDIGGVGVYDFNEAAGALSQLPAPLGCFAGFAVAGCGTFPGGTQYGKIAWAPDGLNFYAAATGPLVNMVVDAAPVCQNRAATVPPNISTAVGLSCADPNGDPVTMQISRAPTAGVLAGVDQAGSSVRYNPFGNYLGADSFGYQGVAKGATSAEATVTLNVQGPSAAVEPPSLSNRIIAQWTPSKTSTSVKTLTVARAQAGSRLRLICKGKGCPFGLKTLEVKKAGDQPLAKNFNFSKKVRGKKRKIVSKLGLGTVVEVQISAAGAIGKAVRYRMRKSKQPATTVLCMPLGSTKTQASC